MLRSDLPFKISLVSVPNNLAVKLALNYTLQDTHKSNMGQNSISYTKKMSIDTFPIELHLRLISYGEQDSRKRLRAYQGSIGMIYIYEKGDIESFKEIIADFLMFKDIYQSMNSYPFFLGVESQSSQESMDEIIEYVKKYGLNNKEINITDIQSFDQFLRSIIMNSQSFQSTTQGSCDINTQ